MNSSEALELTSAFYVAMQTVRPFISQTQIYCVLEGAQGEEKQFFMEKIIELADVITKMPKTYETDGQGQEAIAHLHYFGPAGDFYITEKDMEEKFGQHQAFGLADLGFPELGYISIVELIKNGFELDFHWTPKKVGLCHG